MKVARKHIHSLEDRFNAREADVYVNITRHRNTVIVDVERQGVVTNAELTLSQLAFLLRNADKITSMTGEEKGSGV